jgi:trypsin
VARSGGLLLLIALVLLASMQSLASAARVQPRIVAGDETTIAEAPFQVALYDPLALSASEPQNLRVAQFCGGVIRDASHVLTAAHCVTLGGLEAAAPEEIEVFAGGSDLRSPSEGVKDPVVATSFDPEWNPGTSEHDIGVLTLEKPLWNGVAPEIDGTEKIAPIALAASYPNPGTSATVSGWGFTKPVLPERSPSEAEEAEGYPALLQSAAVSTIFPAECAQDYEEDALLRGDFICAIGEGPPVADACYGDSGGPLFSGPIGSGEDRLLGLVDFGEGCAQKEFPGVYQNVVTGLNRAFASSDPPQAPRNTAAPAIVGRLEAGQTVSCQPGSWLGTSLQFGYTYYRDGVSVTHPFAVEALTGESRDPDYTIQGHDVGGRIFCVVTARNAGGIGEAISDDAVIPALSLPLLVPVTPPSPSVPVKAASPTPSVAPTLRVLSTRCRSGVCTVTVRASNRSGAAAVTRVEATLSFVRRASCRRHGQKATCRRRVSRRLAARPLGSARFSITANGLRPGSYTMALIAVSAAGTRQAHATSVPLVLKAAHARR